MRRRDTFKLLAAAAVTGCTPSGRAPEPSRLGPRAEDPGARAILEVTPLGPTARPWRTADPFLFCVHHDDRYPRADDRFGPAASLEGRQIGSDFEGIDGWRMYHGRVVPGFPQHPHRGFETVTVVREGLLDHADSLGAAARYGEGDVQWLTAGGGILHAEMFPLLDRERPNRTELFQIWLNLPRERKMVDAHFSMLWQPMIPRHVVRDDEGRRTRLTIVAGRYGDEVAAAPPPASWAADPENEVAIWAIAMEAGARFTLPPASSRARRTLYAFAGEGLSVGARPIPAAHEVRVAAEHELTLSAGAAPVELLMLQGRPIDEPIVRHGPFVMNSQAEIERAYADYRRTRFGGWPWRRDDPIHGASPERFARRRDGSVERPG